MNFIIAFQIALLVGCTVLAGLVSGTQAAMYSAAGGASVTLLNLWVLIAVWPRILAKKQVAVAVLAIVFKFAILGLILYLVVHSKSTQLGWFALGLGTVVPNVLVAALKGEQSLNLSEKAEN